MYLFGLPKIKILVPPLLPPFQKDVITRQPHQLTFKAVSRARTTELSFYSEGLWRVVGKAASRHDRPSGGDAVL